MWVFGYGSLIWKTEFDFLCKKEAILYKYERDFCIITEHHRGNKDFKGLVLGLVSNNNKHCKGIAYKICETKINSIRKYLRNRELLEDSYIEKFIEIEIDNKKEIALTYITNIESKLYNSTLTDKEKAKIIKNAYGHSGKNIDYYNNTILNLESIGIKDEKIFNIKNYF